MNGESVCECPSCDDPSNGGGCLNGFCFVCREELNDSEAVWGDKCEKCEKVGE